MVNCCGLLTVKNEPVPLKSVEVELEVRDHVATVVSTLSYENKEDKPIEAVFVFPLPGDAAVCHFSAKIGQTEIVAEVKEKQKAREEYDDALSSGQQAFLLEESEQSPDIFSLSVGSLPPGESALIRLEYVTELTVQADDGLRFCLPAVLNPRYQPQGSGGGNVQVTSLPSSLVPYSLTFCARVSSPRPVSKIESNCSLDPPLYLNTEQTQATVKLAAGHKFDRDVELLIYYKDAHKPTAVVETGLASAKPGTLMGDPVVMLSLYPEFPQAVMSSVASCGEFVFLLDRSGSMDARSNNRENPQTRIGSARDTLLLLLKSLPMGCYFNIYSFGSRFEHIFPKSVEYSQTTMETALKKVGEMGANLGGTEILEPLKHIYNQPCNQPRQLFVFTDGKVGNTKQVIDLVKKNSHSHRCFSFGIGEGASSALINGLAKEGGGHAQFITGTDRLQPKVMQSLRYALQPAVIDISVTWDLPKDLSVTVLSPPITAVFQGQRSLLYAQLTGQISEEAEGCVTVKYSLAGHPSQNQFQFSLKPAEDTGLTVHKLAAQTLIRSLEMEDRESKEKQDESVKKKVVELSVQSGVSSAFTAFIAVNKGDGEAIQGPLVRRNIPTPMLRSFGMSGPAMLCGVPRLMACARPQSIPMSCDLSFNNDECKMKRRALFLKSKSMGRSTPQKERCVPSQPPMDPLLHLVSLQKASGCWDLGPALTAALGKTSKEVEELKPASISEEAEGCVTVKYSLAGHPSQNQFQFSLKPAEDTGLTVHKLAAQTLIRSLEMEDRESKEKQDESVKKKVVELSVQSGVSSAFTAFIAVNKGDGEAIQGPLVRRNIPTPMLRSFGMSGPAMLCGVPRLMACARPQSIPMSCDLSFNNDECKMKRQGLSLKSKSMGRSTPQKERCVPSQPPMDPLLHLVSLQKASGCWDLGPALAAALGKTSKEVEELKPASVNQEVWATILSLIWLHGFKIKVQEEWELLAMKAVSWLRAQNASAVEECMDAGNALLGCKVQKEALGL